MTMYYNKATVALWWYCFLDYIYIRLKLSYFLPFLFNVAFNTPDLLFSTPPAPVSSPTTLRTLRKTQRKRQRQRERHQKKGLTSKTMAVYVPYNSWYISLASSALFAEREPQRLFSFLYLELNGFAHWKIPITLFEINAKIQSKIETHFFTRRRPRRRRCVRSPSLSSVVVTLKVP